MTDIHKNWHRLIQSGVPVKGISRDDDYTRLIKTVSYLKTPTSKNASLIAKPTQLEMWEELKGYTTNATSAPVFVISAINHDRFAIHQAIELASHFLDSNLKIKWHILSGGYFNNRDLNRVNDCDVLFISNVTSESTQHRLEQLRDVISLNHRVLRVIISSGWDGIELSRATGVPVNGLMWLGRSK